MVAALTCRCSDSGFTHGVTYLVEPDDNVAGRVQTDDGGPLMSVDPDAALVGQVSADGTRQIRVDDRTQGRIDRIEALPTLGVLQRQAAVVQFKISNRAVDADDPKLVETSTILNLEIMATVWGDERYFWR